VQPGLISSGEEDLLRFVLEFHLHAHLLKGPEDLAVKEFIQLITETQVVCVG